MDRASLMAGKYGLTGGEAATMNAGIAAAANVQLSSLESKLNLASKGQLDKLIQDPEMRLTDHPLAVQSFVAMINDGTESGAIKTADDISSRVKDAYIKRGFTKAGLESLIEDIFSGQGKTIDSDFWNTFRSSYAASGAKTTNK